MLDHLQEPHLQAAVQPAQETGAQMHKKLEFGGRHKHKTMEF